jgi:uncharacterized protein
MIIDTHCHLDDTSRFIVPDASLATLLRTMDRLGIERGINAPALMFTTTPDEGLRQGLAAYRESHGRILLYTLYHPYEPDSLAFVRRSLEEPAVVGIKIHPAVHLCPADDERWRPLWELAAETATPILTHSWCASDYNPAQKHSQPALFAKYVSEFPSVALILGHSGGRYEGHLAATALARTHSNVYLDIAGDIYGLGLIEYLVAQAGADRVLYGSDYQWFDPRSQLGMILDAAISPADKAKILRDNAIKLFGLTT